MTKCPVIVIGGGFAGLTTAMCLARAKVPVKLFFVGNDKNAATPAAHGICAIKGILESDTERFGLQLRGHQGFDHWLRGWESYLGRTRPKKVWISGVREVFRGREEFAAEFGRIYRKDFTGAKDVFLSAGADNVFVETFYPGDFWIDPSYLITTYQDSCTSLGVTFEDRRVTGISTNHGSVVVSCEGGFTDWAEVVVLCAGSGTVEILGDSNCLPEDLYAVSGYTFKVGMTAGDSCYVKKTNGFAVKDNCLHLGSSSDKSTRIEGQPSILGRSSPDEERLLAKKLFHEACGETVSDGETLELTSLESRRGVRVRTRGRGPLVKQVIQSGAGGVWVNTGYYKSGIILSWLMAKDLAEEITQVVIGG